MKAEDLIIPLQEYLTPDHPLKEASNLFSIARRGEEKIGVKALPLLDTKGELLIRSLVVSHTMLITCLLKRLFVDCHVALLMTSLVKGILSIGDILKSVYPKYKGALPGMVW